MLSFSFFGFYDFSDVNLGTKSGSHWISVFGRTFIGSWATTLGQQILKKCTGSVFGTLPHPSDFDKYLILGFLDVNLGT